MIRFLTRWFKRIELKGKIRDIDRDIRAVEWERSIMLADINYTRADRMKAIIHKLQQERRELVEQLRQW